MFSTSLYRQNLLKNVCYRVKFLSNLKCQKQKWKTFSDNYMSYHQKRGSEIKNVDRQLPTLIYVQNPITWFINKIDFKMLKSAWDSDFDEAEFKRGTMQVNIISNDS